MELVAEDAPPAGGRLPLRNLLPVITVGAMRAAPLGRLVEHAAAKQ
jgi:hypothetical protein